jgi:hypothetical protein
MLNIIHENIYVVKEESEIIDDDEDKDFLAICLNSLQLVDILARVVIKDINTLTKQPDIEFQKPFSTS